MSEFRSPLLARDYKFFEAAKRAAEESDFKVHVGAVAVYQGRVIASAASLEKTHPVLRRQRSGAARPALHHPSRQEYGYRHTWHRGPASGK